MTDPLPALAATIHRSPADIADWPITVAITHVDCAPGKGFSLTFDRPIPEAWKWPSNPAVPSDNYQFTVWAVVSISGVWHGAGFVQLWQNRPMEGNALPAWLTVTDGVPGYVNWWGDVRHLWGEMALYVPQPGDRIGLLISAGNARLTDGVTSVRERSNLVWVTVNAGDLISVDAPTDGPGPVPDPMPIPDPVPIGDLAASIAQLTARITQAEQAAEARHTVLMVQLSALFSLWTALELRGTATIPYLGVGAVDLKAVLK